MAVLSFFQNYNVSRQTQVHLSKSQTRVESKLQKTLFAHPDVQRGSANRQTSFSGRAMPGKNCHF